jgi:hypothetical protein
MPSDEHEHDTEWSLRVATLVVDALIVAKIVQKADLDRAIAIAQEEIRVRLIANDRPDAQNWRYQS